MADLIGAARPGLIGASLLAGFGLIGLSAWFWSVSLRMLDAGPSATPTWSHLVLVTARALPGRYVPGGVAFAVSRVSLLRRAGAGVGPLSATAGLEMALSLTVALAYGVVLLGFAGVFPGGQVWVVTVLALLGIGASPTVGGRAVAWVANRRGVDITMTWGGHLRLVGVSVGFWTWSAAAFMLYLRAFPVTDELETVRSAGAFMLSWGVGFLSVIAPQGIGVAEGSLAALLDTHRLGNQEAGNLTDLVVILGGYRLVLLVRDLIAAAGAEIIATARARPVSPPTG